LLTNLCEHSKSGYKTYTDLFTVLRTLEGCIRDAEGSPHPSKKGWQTYLALIQDLWSSNTKKSERVVGYLDTINDSMTTLEKLRKVVAGAEITHAKTNEKNNAVFYRILKDIFPHQDSEGNYHPRTEILKTKKDLIDNLNNFLDIISPVLGTTDQKVQDFYKKMVDRSLSGDQKAIHTVEKFLLDNQMALGKLIEIKKILTDIDDGDTKATYLYWSAYRDLLRTFCNPQSRAQSIEKINAIGVALEKLKNEHEDINQLKREALEEIAQYKNEMQLLQKDKELATCWGFNNVIPSLKYLIEIIEPGSHIQPLQDALKKYNEIGNRSVDKQDYQQHVNEICRATAQLIKLAPVTTVNEEMKALEEQLGPYIKLKKELGKSITFQFKKSNTSDIVDDDNKKVQELVDSIAKQVIQNNDEINLEDQLKAGLPFANVDTINTLVDTINGDIDNYKKTPVTLEKIDDHLKRLETWDKIINDYNKLSGINVDVQSFSSAKIELENTRSLDPTRVNHIESEYASVSTRLKNLPNKNNALIKHRKSLLCLQAAEKMGNTESIVIEDSVPKAIEITIQQQDNRLSATLQNKLVLVERSSEQYKGQVLQQTIKHINKQCEKYFLNERAEKQESHEKISQAWENILPLLTFLPDPLSSLKEDRLMIMHWKNLLKNIVTGNPDVLETLYKSEISSQINNINTPRNASLFLQAFEKKCMNIVLEKVNDARSERKKNFITAFELVYFNKETLTKLGKDVKWMLDDLAKHHVGKNPDPLYPPLPTETTNGRTREAQRQCQLAFYASIFVAQKARLRPYGIFSKRVNIQEHENNFKNAVREVFRDSNLQKQDLSAMNDILKSRGAPKIIDDSFLSDSAESIVQNISGIEGN
jgi:hypothetical protein